MDHWKSKIVPENIYFCFIDYAIAFDCVDHNKLWKVLKDIGIPDLTCLLRNLYAKQAATVRTGHGITDWFQIRKEVCQSCILSLCLISSASIRSIPFLSFIVPIFAWNVPLVSLIFLKRSLVFPTLLFSSISFHWSLRRASYLSLLFLELCIHMGISFLFFFSLLPFAFLLFSAICKASSDNHFVFFAFLFLGYVLDHCLL